MRRMGSFLLGIQWWLFLPSALQVTDSPCGQAWGPEHRTLDLKEHLPPPPGGSWQAGGLLWSFHVEIPVDSYSGPAVSSGRSPSASARVRSRPVLLSCRNVSDTAGAAAPRAEVGALLQLCWGPPPTPPVRPPPAGPSPSFRRAHCLQN